jgi:hypothetical protein
MTLSQDRLRLGPRLVPTIAFAPGLTQNSAQMQSKRSQHLYEVRPRKDKRGVDLTCQACDD